MTSELALTAQYERAISRPIRGPLAAFAEEAYRLARTDPLALCSSIAGRTSTAASGLLVPDSRDGATPPLRLAGISLGRDPLLRRAYDAFGRLSSVEYPDKQRVVYGYGQDNQPESVSIGAGIRIQKRWDDLGNLLSVDLNSGGARLLVQRAADGTVQKVTHGIDSLSFIWSAGRLAAVRSSDSAGITFVSSASNNSGELRIDLGSLSAIIPMIAGASQVMSADCPGRPASYLASALGLMRLDKNGRVTFWLQPDGNPMWFVHDASGRISQVWTTAGVALCEHGDGQYFAVLSPASGRFLLREVSAGSSALIGPDVVSLVRRDASGRIHSVLGMWGDSILFRYGLLKRSTGPVLFVSSKWGEIRIRYAKGTRLASVSLADKALVKLSYRKEGPLDQVAVEGSSWEDMLSALRTAGFLYCLRSASEADFHLSFLWGQYVT